MVGTGSRNESVSSEHKHQNVETVIVVSVMGSFILQWDIRREGPVLQLYDTYRDLRPFSSTTVRQAASEFLIKIKW